MAAFQTVQAKPPEKAEKFPLKPLLPRFSWTTKHNLLLTKILIHVLVLHQGRLYFSRRGMMYVPDVVQRERKETK